MSKGNFNYLFEKYNLNTVALGMINIRGNSDSQYYRNLLPKIIDPNWEDNREIILDEVDNSNEVAKNHPETTRPVNHDLFLGSIQIIMKGKNSDNDYRMCVRNIELYGFLKYK